MIDDKINANKQAILGYEERKLNALLSLCESPIEKLFLTNFLEPYFKCGFTNNRINYLYKFTRMDDNGNYLLEIEPQFDKRMSYNFYERHKCIVGIEIKNMFIPYTFSIYPQYKIITSGGKKYRVDFAIIGNCYFSKAKEERIDFKILIECDGHDFHSSKDQRKRDNSRANALKAEGWVEFLYSGSTIVDEEFFAAKEFDALIMNNYKPYEKDFEID